MKFPYFRCVQIALAMLSGAAIAAPLPQLAIDKTQTTVSGVSSGGYMAVQLHVAYSATFNKGAAVLAGGPYNCAEGSVLNAIGRCLGRAAIPVADLVKITDDWAKSGTIDATTNLSNSRVYLFSGAKDSVVPPATTAALQTYYQSYLPAANIVYKKDIEAEHAIVTDDYGAACLTKAAPFINNCNFDLAGAMLQHLYGALMPRSSGAVSGTLIEFEQTTFVAGHGMAATGWVYVPKSCASGSVCRVHVALHGCKQNATDVGQEFVRNAGYNRWADANNIVVLYPQTGKGATNSCWDWWGYDDANYAKKSAPQMMGIVAMIEHLSRGKGPTAAPAVAR
jgi:poly(3-hydroxybutyrate) depolymerase